MVFTGFYTNSIFESFDTSNQSMHYASPGTYQSSWQNTTWTWTSLSDFDPPKAKKTVEEQIADNYVISQLRSSEITAKSVSTASATID